MNMQTRQKVNAFLSATVSAVGGMALAQGYQPGSNFFLALLGGMILAAGIALLIEDLTETQANLGSSDLILGAGKILIGGYILFFSSSASQHLHGILAGILLFHTLFLLQLAAEVRFLAKSRAFKILWAAAVSLIAAVVAFLLPSGSSYEILISEICLFADAAAVLVTAFLILRVKDKPHAAAKAQPDAASIADAAAVHAAEACGPLDACEATLSTDTDATVFSEDTSAAPSGEAEAAAAKAQAAADAKEEAEDVEAVGSMMRGFGNLVHKTGSRLSTTAKKTVAGFQDGIAEGNGEKKES